MSLPKKEDYIFYQGEKFQVEFYFTKTGKIPAKEYLEKAKNMKKTYTARLKEEIYYEKN
jgi:hypothetical protein